MTHRLVLSLIFLLIVCGCATQQEQQLSVFIESHTGRVEPLLKEAHLAYWRAANTGHAEDYDKASELEYEIRQIYSNPEDFAMLGEFKASRAVRDPRLARQLEVLYNAYLGNQVEPELLKQIVELGVSIEKNFSTFRGTVRGEKVTANAIKDMLKSETDSARRKEAWLASKQVGPVVATDLIQLVKLRNEAARAVGFENYHTLSLTTGEQNVKELDRIFDELYELTHGPFGELKHELDGILAAMYHVDADALRPWHYHDPFFQESPLVYDLDLDSYYQDADVKELAMRFYAGIGLPVDSIIEHSDLYEREGKNPHAFCTDIDRKGDVRILCNLQNDEQWMETVLHELGHGVYDYYRDEDVPFLLREPAHIFSTEAVAMFFGRLSRNGAWMQGMLNLTEGQRAEIEKVSGKYAQLKQLIFVRWAMVMYHFEKQLYADPDQDLNALWWRMVEQYQQVKKPEGRDEPDWASKIHFAIAPCYYHNYVLGELLASQMHHYLVRNVLKLDSDNEVSYIGQRGAGDFFREKIFAPAALYRWDRMIERATGEPLTPKYFVEQFVLN